VPIRGQIQDRGRGRDQIEKHTRGEEGKTTEKNEGASIETCVLKAETFIDNSNRTDPEKKPLGGGKGKVPRHWGKKLKGRTEE